MKILVAGDFCPRDRITDLIEREKFDGIFHDMREVVNDADYSLVNFECPVVKRQAEPIVKQGPNLRCTEKGVDAIKYVGFDCATLANNHFCDYGDIGVEDTINSLKEKGVDIVGGGRNLSEASTILYKEINELKVAIINCCEHEFSIAKDEVMKSEYPKTVIGGGNPLSTISQYYAIQEAKQNADKIVVIVHGGHEHFQLPSPRMVETYRFFIDAGADAVINHHQHCFSGYERYKNGLIFYGLGNFCFDDKKRHSSTWNQGYMVLINFERSQDLSFEVYPYIQCDVNPQVRLMTEDEKVEFDKKIVELNDIIKDNKRLLFEHQEFMNRTSSSYRLALEPYTNRYTKALYHRALLPSFLNHKRTLSLMNFLNCESHFDRLKYAVAQLNYRNNE